MRREGESLKRSAYSPKWLREKWQAYWDENETFRAPNPGETDFDASRPKNYILDFFPYPSGAGLHVGHPEGYTATDIVARYRRMRGYNVLHTMGWDAFGLPAEQHAIETGQHPAVTTEQNIATFRRQLKLLGFSYDWRRELSTTDPKYYKWTQWIFLTLFNSWYDSEQKKARPIGELSIPDEVKTRGEKAVREFIDSQRLAYLAEVPVNWCPALGTVLSNEEVTNEGRSERGNHPVYKRPLKQWMLRITKYANRLADDLEELDWPESVKLMQRNWIGRSEGAEVTFRVDGHDSSLEIYTTRPDTLFGATYMVLAPEHPLVKQITTPDRRAEVDAYCEAAINRSELARTAEAKEKTGVFTGAYANNPVYAANDPRGRIPIWVADYVLMSYGTGAIMAVPGHDDRDFEFARDKGLPVVAVIQPPADWLVQCWDIEIAIEVLEEQRGNQEYEGGTNPEELAARLNELTSHPYEACLSCVNAGLSDTPTEEQVQALIRLYRRWPRCFVEAYCADSGEARVINSPPAEICGTGVSPVTGVGEDEHITRRNLPHIQRGGSTYFLTFRVKRGQLSPDERTIALHACDYWHGRKLTLHAAVVMPDHVHLLMTPHERVPGEWVSLTEIMHSIKSYSAHAICKRRNSKETIWLDETFDRLVRNEREFVEKREYIEGNPVTAGLVTSPEQYSWLIRRNIEFQDTEHRRDAGATGGSRTAYADINDHTPADAKRKIIAWLEARGLGKGAVNYKLRDWLFSRQRYWGEPIPVLHGPDGEIVPLDASELPLTLPEIDDFRPTVTEGNEGGMPEPPLGRAKTWATVTRNGKSFKRELNTMPQWAGSCWYYLRFCEPWNDGRFVGEDAERYWMLSKRKDGRPHVGGIDLYLGGAEHAVLHLLYARFWHKVLYDLGYVSTVEPFGKLFNQGMIRAYAYRDARGVPYAYDEIDFRDDGTAVLKSTGEKLQAAVEKMSKSLKNVINPDDVVTEYGADALRLYEMFMGPLEASKPWNPRDVPGVFRFLQRAWRLIVDEDTGDLSSFVVGEPAQESRPIAMGRLPGADALERSLHKTIQKVTQDIERMAFNTAISAMMEFVNEAYRAKAIRRDQAERFVLLLSAFAPHISEELWQRLRGSEWKGSVSKEPWPAWDEKLVVEDEVEIPVQVSGKVVARITIPRDASEETARNAAMANAKVAERLAGRTVAKTIFVAGRLLNLVVP